MIQRKWREWLGMRMYKIEDIKEENGIRVRERESEQRRVSGFPWFYTVGAKEKAAQCLKRRNTATTREREMGAHVEIVKTVEPGGLSLSVATI